MRNDGRRRSVPAKLLIALGIAAQLAAALALISVDPVLEYAVPAPEVRRAEASADGSAQMDAGLDAMIEAREDVEKQMGTAVAALSMGGEKSGASASFGGQTQEAALRAVDLRWLETCPRRLTAGRWMDAEELKRGARVCALDEDLAFALFGSDEALDEEIEIEGEKYRVIGTLRHRRGVGEVDASAMYVPLRAVAKQGVQLDTLTMRALSAVSSGLSQSYSEAMRSAWGAGELHDLRKERMGALLLTRLLLCAFGLALAFRLARRYAAVLSRWRAQVAERKKHAYVWRWLGPALLRALGALLGAAALLAAVYGLLSFGIAPVYSFTEWVPESLVSLRALKAVFWSRASDAARLISIATPESARIAFWGALDRAGAVALLLGLALGKKKYKKVAKDGNQSGADGV